MKTLLLLLLIITVTATSVATQSQTPNVDQLVRTAYVQLRANELEAAEASCLQILKLYPKEHRAYALLGFVYQTQHKLKSASEAFAKAVQIKHDAKELYLAKSRVDYLRNAHDDALVAAQQAVKIDPKFAEAHLMIGSLLRWNKERSAEAIAAYEAAIKLNPRLWQAYEDLGQIFEQNKDEKRAEEIFRSGMAADPKRMAGRFTLGRMLVKQGKLTEARALWDARTSDEDKTHPQFILLLTRAENLKKATEALAKSPNDPVALLEMGLMVMEGDSWVYDSRQKRAIEYFRKALVIKPDYARAQWAIVKAYIQMADVFKNENKNVEIELEKLKQLDAKLAEEMVEYRKSYRGGIRASPLKVDQ